MASDVCVLVGVGPNLGLSLARRFGREGCRLALLARRAAALEDYARVLADDGIEARAYGADASQPESLTAALDRVRRELGDPSILLYNAAHLRERHILEATPEQLVEDYRANVVGAVTCVQRLAPALRAARRGTILLTGGGLALDPVPQWGSLAIGKAAVRNVTLSLAKALEPDGVHVATVTVAGWIRKGTAFDPDRVADAFWRLHAQPRDAWERELVFRGE